MGAKDLLTDTTVKNTKPKDKPQRLNDGGGLYVLVKSTGLRKKQRRPALRC